MLPSAKKRVWMEQDKLEMQRKIISCLTAFQSKEVITLEILSRRLRTDVKEAIDLTAIILSAVQCTRDVVSFGRWHGLPCDDPQCDVVLELRGGLNVRVSLLGGISEDTGNAYIVSKNASSANYVDAKERLQRYLQKQTEMALAR